MDVRLLVDLVLVVLCVEALALWLASRRLPSLPRFATMLPNLGAGLCLILAVDCALRGASLAILSFLALAGICHAADLRTRLKR